MGSAFDLVHLSLLILNDLEEISSAPDYLLSGDGHSLSS